MEPGNCSQQEEPLTQSGWGLGQVIGERYLKKRHKNKSGAVKGGEDCSFQDRGAAYRGLESGQNSWNLAAAGKER